MNITDILITIGTSSAISGLIALGVKIYFKSWIEHMFHVELTDRISELVTKFADQRDIASRRVQGYPKIVELVYRIRNMARDLTTSFSPSVLSLADELVSRTCELEDHLYKFRSDLERDNLFLNVHKYKNAAKNFNMKVSDIKYFMEHKEALRVDNAQKELASLYEDIEPLHSLVIQDLSAPHD